MRGALKFETKNFHGITPLFWEQKAQIKDKKKFGYKSRNMKFPLRSNVVVPSSDPPKVQPNRKLNFNKRDTSVTVQRQNRTADQQLPATKQKTKETSNAKQKKHLFAETVTLTKAQLEAILASVGKLPITDKNQSSQNETNTLEEQDVKEVIHSKHDSAASNQDGSHIVKNREASAEEGYEQAVKEVTIQHREEPEKDFIANIQLHGQINTIGNKARNSVHNVQEKAANQHPISQLLSLSERKKRQWQKEKAEQLQIYDPWGRPGAGAPLIDSKGQVITNYKAYQARGNMLTGGQTGLAGNVPAEIGQQTNLPQPSDTTGQTSSAQGMEPSESSSVLPVLSTEFSGMSFTTQQPSSANQYNPADIDGKRSSRPIAVVPAAMRSSFLIGHNDIPDYEIIREDEKRKWLMELEKQKEEQRLHKLEHSFTHIASSMTQRSDSSLGQKSSHLRSHLNLHMDPVTQQQLEMKKRKNEELMVELKAQINEQQNRKRLEWEKIQLEDAADEQRLLEQQQLLNQQYEHELLKEKLKMEAKEKKLKQLAATIDQAREEALLDKKLKRLQYLERHGHDTSRLQGDLAASCRSVSSWQSKDTRYAASSSKISACNQDQALSNAREGLHEQSSYQSRLRDFGSQTDSCLLSKCELSDVEIEYESEEETNNERIPEENNFSRGRPSVKSQ